MGTNSDERIRDEDGHIGIDWLSTLDREIGHVKESMSNAKQVQDEAIRLAREGQERLLKDFPITYALKAEITPVESQIKYIEDNMVGKTEHARVREDVEKLKDGFATIPADYVNFETHKDLLKEVQDLRDFKTKMQSLATQEQVAAAAALAGKAQVLGIISAGVAIFGLILSIVIVVINVWLHTI